LSETDERSEVGSQSDLELSSFRESREPTAAPRTRRRRRFRFNPVPWILAICILGGWLFYVFALPWLQLEYLRWLAPKRTIFPAELDLKLGQRTLLRTCEFLFVGWVFYFGASIGSFLNVVAGRVPEGKTIVFGGSKCPFCNTRLSFIDNTPVLGWLILRGRCRSCRLPIAPRYLLIEIVIGLLFVWLALWQLVRNGANLPHADLSGWQGVTELVFFPNWQMISTFFLHAAMYAVLVMMAVGTLGKRAFPVTAFLVIIGLFAIARISISSSEVVQWSEPWMRMTARGMNGAIGFGISVGVSVLIGAIIGLLVGWITSQFLGSDDSKVLRQHWVLESILIGCVTGWQATVLIVILGILAARWYAWIRRVRLYPHEECNTINPLGMNICLVVVCMLHHSFWRQMAQLFGIV